MLNIAKQDPNVRLKQHNSPSGGSKGLTGMESVADGLTRQEAKALEQYIMEKGSYIENGMNKYNSIAKTNPVYTESMQFAENYARANGTLIR